MNSFALARPIAFVLCVVAGFEALLLAVLLAARLWFPDLPLSALDSPLLLVQAVFTAGIIIALGWWKKTGFGAMPTAHDLGFALLPLAVLVLPTIALGVELPTGARGLMLGLMVLLIAFHEEGIFRGVIVQALAPLGYVQAAAGSAILFGLIHFNSLLVGRNVDFVIAQVVASVLGGFGLAAMRLRMKSIWPLVGLHAINDFFQFSVTGGLGAAEVGSLLVYAKVGLSLIIGLYGIYLLRPSAQQPVASVP